MNDEASSSGLTRILMIDDDRKFCRLVATYLEPLGFAVSAVHSGPEGVELAVATGPAAPQAVILDVMLPGFDGFEVLRRIREKSAMPVLMLTARGDETDRIVGLEVGADDYLPKTFSTRELLARLRAVLRRAAAPTPASDPRPDEIVAGPLHLNLDARTAVLDATPLTLTPVEFDLLATLAKSRGRVRSREALIEEIRSRDYDVFDRSIDVHVSSLRKKLGDDPKSPRFIRTLRSAGYMFAPVSATPPEPMSATGS